MESCRSWTGLFLSALIVKLEILILSSDVLDCLGDGHVLSMFFARVIADSDPDLKYWGSLRCSFLSTELRINPEHNSSLRRETSIFKCFLHSIKYMRLLCLLQQLFRFHTILIVVHRLPCHAQLIPESRCACLLA